MNLNLEQVNHNLICLIAADKILNPGINLAGKTEMAELSTVIHRNLQLILAFPEIFGDLSNISDISENLLQGINDSIWAGIEDYLDNIRPAELLHVPGHLHELMLSKISSAGGFSKRKRQGSYYTPANIISYMTDISLCYLFKNVCAEELNGIKILDPACGGASFLIEVWIKLVNSGLAEFDAIKCVYGRDIDMEAVNTAVFALTLAVMSRTGQSYEPHDIKHLWQNQIKKGNTLSAINGSLFEGIDWMMDFPAVFDSTCENPGFDIVIGNPPYISNKIIPTGQKKYYGETFCSASGQYDLSVLFMEQGLNLLREGGILTYITSNKFLAADYGKNMRKILLRNFEITEMVDVSTLKCFKNTSVYPVIISVKKSRPTADSCTKIINISSWSELKTTEPVVLNLEFFKEHRDFILTTQINNKIYPILRKIESVLGRIPEQVIRCGIAQTGFGKWVSKNGTTNEDNLNRLHPFIQAGHIEPFKIKDTDFIDKTFFNSDKWLNINGPKMVIPGIAKKLTAAVDLSDSITGRVYFVRQAETNYDLSYLAVLFNSYVLNFYYKVMYWPVHLEGGYLRFNSTYLANLPVFLADKILPDKRALITIITKIGQKLLCDSITGMELENNKTEAEALTFLLYGLSADDAEVIMDFLDISSSDKIKTLNSIEEQYSNMESGRLNAGKND